MQCTHASGRSRLRPCLPLPFDRRRPPPPFARCSISLSLSPSRRRSALLAYCSCTHHPPHKLSADSSPGKRRTSDSPLSLSNPPNAMKIELNGISLADSVSAEARGASHLVHLGGVGGETAQKSPSNLSLSPFLLSFFLSLLPTIGSVASFSLQRRTCCRC